MGNFIAGAFLLVLLSALFTPFVGIPLFLLLYYSSKRSQEKKDRQLRAEIRREIRAEEPTMELSVVVVNHVDVSGDAGKRRQDYPTISSYGKVFHSSHPDRLKAKQAAYQQAEVFVEEVVQEKLHNEALAALPFKKPR